MTSQRRLSEPELGDYLVSVGVLPRNRPVEIELAGDGNINWVRRVVAGRRSWIVKQARPALEAFPEYRVSTERIAFESRYFARARAWDTDRVLPEVVHFDPDRSVLVLEDLRDAVRLDAALRDGLRARDLEGALTTLARFLGRVHRESPSDALEDEFGNSEMQRLHGDHIFWLPFRDNDFPLSDRVGERAEALRGDTELVRRIDSAYECYLNAGAALVHADVQPTNILLQPAGPKLLDAEIAHVGDPAFDIGVLLAHLRIASLTGNHTEGARGALRATWTGYLSSGPTPASFAAAARYAGIEMLRRTLGAARVPAVSEDDAALRVIEEGVAWIDSPPVDPVELT